MRHSLSALILLAVLSTVSTMARAEDGPWSSFEKGTLNPGELSQATPADVGLPFEQIGRAHV